MRNLALFAVLSVALLGVSGCVNREAQAQGKKTEAILNDKTPVIRTTPSRAQSVQAQLEIAGQLTSTADTVIGARVAGRLVSVMVRDGDPVSSGQVIAMQDTSTLMAQLRQAQGQVAAARAALQQAISNRAINPKRSASGVRAAEAQLAQAKAQLAKARAGARTEERRQAEIAVQAAKSNLDTAKKEMERQKALFDEGATSQQRYEVAQNAYQQALAGYENALQALEIVRNGVRPEDLAAAEEAVRQAEEGVRNAKANQELDVTWNQSVDAARANLQSAQAQVDLIRTQMADAVVRAPFAGKISGKPAQVGEVLGPGAPVARLIGGDGVYFEGEVPETAIESVLPGSQVTITLAALPGRTFGGTVIAVNPLGEAVGRIFRVRIAFDQVTSELKSGMFARGAITTESVADAVTVPKTAIVRDGTDDVVFVLEGTKAKRVKVQPGLAAGEWIQVKGLQAGAKVITTGQNGLRDGIDVREETQEAAAETRAEG